MCRLLGVVSSQPTTLPESVGSQLAGFIELSAMHRDGWGLSWRDGTGTVRTVKGAPPAAEDENLMPALDGARSTELLLHLRLATPGSPIVIENNHPFDDGVIAFAHNGSFSPTAQLRHDLREWGAWQPRGTTDSELYFSLVRHFGRTMSWPDAIHQAAARITADERLSDTPGGPCMNCLLLTDQGMFCYSQYDIRRLLPEWEPDYYEMWIARDDDRVVVASSNWQLPGHEVLEPTVVVHIAPDLSITRYPAP